MKTPGLKMSRRRFLGGVSFAAAGTLGYAKFIEAERLQASHLTVPVSKGTRAPLKLLHLSDLHASHVVSLQYIESAIFRALQWKPDLICLTGDFVTARFERAQEYVRVLRRLSSAAPCHAVLGNHDGGVWAGGYGGYADCGWISEVLRESQIDILHNTSTTVQAREWKINLVGVGDCWAEQLDSEAAFRGVDQSRPTVLLSHNPDTKDELIRHDWQLMLSGHTHGGQLRVPWLGATPFAPVKDKRFVEGLHHWEDRWLHITKGIGTVYGLRINCPPEVSLLTLT